MKKIIAALTALVLMMLCGCAPQEAPAAAAAPEPPAEMEFSDSAILRNEDVDTLLICAVAYDDSGFSTLTSLNVLVRNAQGSISLLTIPKDTLVWVEQYDETGSYAYDDYTEIRNVYHAAESAGLAEAKTVEAVSALLGGVRIDRYALLNVVQLKDLAELTDGVYVLVEDGILDYGIPRGYQNIVPSIMEYASYSYLNDIGGTDYPGTDLYKLERHQQLIQAIMQTFAGQMGVMDEAERLQLSENIRSCIRTDLTDEELLRWLEDDALDFADVRILKGRQNDQRNESYWIPDQTALREWVTEYFYLADEKDMKTE